MKILLTGDRGLIGESLYNRLTDQGHDVNGFDIDDNWSMYLDDYEMIIHCASKCVIRDVIKNPQQMIDNIKITYKVMESARMMKAKVILLSSGRLSYDEKNPYTVSKKFLEEIAEAYKNCYGVDSIVIRPETVWGKNDTTRVMALWIKRAKENKNLIIYGDKDKELPPIYVEDFVDEFMKLFAHFNKFKNKKPITISGKIMLAKDVAKTIIKTLKSKSKIIFKSAELSQPQKTVRDVNDIRVDNNLKKNLKVIK